MDPLCASYPFLARLPACPGRGRVHEMNRLVRGLSWWEKEENGSAPGGLNEAIACAVAVAGRALTVDTFKLASTPQ